MYLNLIKKTWDKLNSLCQSRINQFGQQYISFAIFGIINYPLAYLYQVYYAHLPDTENLPLRLTATFLCIILLFGHKSSRTLQQYLPLYWYFTLAFSIPFLGTYLLLQNHTSLDWIINMGIGLVILILLVDWLMFLALVSIGSTAAFVAFVILNGFPKLNIIQHENILGLYLYVCILICGIVFSSRKQAYQTNMILRKNQLNEKLINTVKQKSQEILATLDEKKHFLQNFSHELRTPLHSILGLSAQLNSHFDKLPQHRVKSILSMIYSSSFNLSEMVNNIIDLSFYTSEKTIFTFKPTNFKHLILSCIETNRAFLEATAQNISIELIYDKDLEENITLDAIKIAQVINNLISNAIKYSRPDSKQVLIHVTKEKTNNLSFAIIDEGIGIPPKEKGLIFNAFVRGSNSKKLGKGIGLAIVKEIISGHNGKIRVQKTSKKGTTIMFSIPKKQQEKL